MHATIGDNSKDLTPAESKALFMHHFGIILKQSEICKAENNKRLKLRKEAKADGIILADIDFALRCAQIEDPDIIVNEQRRRAAIGQYFALPIGAQTEFDFDREPAVDRAKREGEAAGYAAKNADEVPYEENSDLGRAWLAGWKAGNMQLAQWTIAKQKADAASAKAVVDDGANDPDDEPDEAA